ncbi:MAG: hypothetical protein PUB39_02275 [Eubacteriales bacterium]|nr:hypothetical protein [Eubacteriales bacterium]
MKKILVAAMTAMLAFGSVAPAAASTKLPAKVSGMKVVYIDHYYNYIEGNSGYIKASWKKVKGAKKYEVYVKDLGKGTKKDGYKSKYRKAGTTTKTSKKMKVKYLGTSVYVKVRAVNKRGKGKFSKTTEPMEYSTSNKYTVKKIKCIRVTNQRLYTEWEPVNGADGYRVYMKGIGKSLYNNPVSTDLYHSYGERNDFSASKWDACGEPEWFEGKIKPVKKSRSLLWIQEGEQWEAYAEKKEENKLSNGWDGGRYFLVKVATIKNGKEVALSKAKKFYVTSTPKGSKLARDEYNGQGVEVPGSRSYKLWQSIKATWKDDDKAGKPTETSAETSGTETQDSTGTESNDR